MSLSTSTGEVSSVPCAQPRHRQSTPLVDVDNDADEFSDDDSLGATPSSSPLHHDGTAPPTIVRKPAAGARGRSLMADTQAELCKLSQLYDPPPTQGPPPQRQESFISGGGPMFTDDEDEVLMVPTKINVSKSKGTAESLAMMMEGTLHSLPSSLVMSESESESDVDDF